MMKGYNNGCRKNIMTPDEFMKFFKKAQGIASRKQTVPKAII